MILWIILGIIQGNCEITVKMLTDAEVSDVDAKELVADNNTSAAGAKAEAGKMLKHLEKTCVTHVLVKFSVWSCSYSGIIHILVIALVTSNADDVPVQRSPPLRRGTRSKVAGKEQQDGYADMKADPGMVLNYKAAEEVQPQPAAPQPDLLDFDGLSMDAPPAANAQVRPCM